MKNKKHFFFFLTLAFFFFGSEAVAQNIFLPNYTTKDGLPSNHCFYTLQDKKGFIWIATDAGVSRFDGSVFENFSIDDGLPDNQILQLQEDSRGRVWFFSLNGQLSFFLNGKIYNQDNFKPLAGLNFNAVVVSFFEDSKQRIWFGTNNNVIGMWDGETTVKFTSKDKIHKYQNSFIYEDKNNNIWAINSKGNFTFSKDKFTPTAQKIDPLSYKTIQHTDNNAILYVDKNGLNTTDGSKITNLLPLKEKLTKNNLGYIYADKNELWLSNDNGVTVINYQQQTRSILKGIAVSQTLKDKFGNMWFTTKNGIYKMPQLKDQLYLYQPKNTNNYNFKSIVKDPYERLWLGAANGSIQILDIKSRKKTAIKLQDTAKFNLIKQLVVDKKNNKIFFASDYGLGAVSANYPTVKNFKFLRETNNHVYVVKNFSIDTTTNLSLSMSSGVVIIKDRERLEFSSFKYKEQVDFFKNRSYRVFYDSHQNLWFSNISGLSEFSNHQLQQHYQKHLLLTKRINDIVELPDGAIAMATDGYGIVIFKNQQIIHVFNHKNGLHNNIVNRLFVRDQHLWAISNTGINRITITGKHAKISSFDDVNEVLADNLNDLYVTKDTAYFATNNGLVYFAKDHSLQHSIAPAVYITNIVSNHQQLDLTQKTFTLPPNRQNITFSYSAVDFNHKNITYRYRLKSHANWVETKNRKLELFALAPGSYTFEVSAKSQNSEWSTPTKIKLILQQKFYRTWWFITLLLLLGAYLIYSITIDLTKRKKNKEKEELLLKNKILMLEQKALQAMMNPHFVFNVMNSIQHYINTQNTTSANKVLTGFARLIRKNLEICTHSYISLADEINYLELYLSLEKNRFGEKFQYEIIVESSLDREETLIPSMILQPYIENAIWHGIMPKEDGGKVTISITQENEDVLLIKIIDDGIGIENALNSKKDDHQSKGMTLISERIKLLNQIEAKAIQLHIQQNGKTGTIVTISIPIKD